MKSPSIKKKPIKQNITKTKQEKPQKYINKNIKKKSTNDTDAEEEEEKEKEKIINGKKCQI